MLTLFSQVLVSVQCPYIMYRKGHGIEVGWFAIFKLFPVRVKEKFFLYALSISFISLLTHLRFF